MTERFYCTVLLHLAHDRRRELLHVLHRLARLHGCTMYDGGLQPGCMGLQAGCRQAAGSCGTSSQAGLAWANPRHGPLRRPSPRPPKGDGRRWR